MFTTGEPEEPPEVPDAACKFFLTASSRERAERRFHQLQQRGTNQTVEQVLADQEERDRRDSQRPVGKLVKADDAVEVVTDGLTLEAVVDHDTFR